MSKHRILKSIVGVAIMVLATSQSAVASGSAGQIRVGLLLGYGISDHEDVNRPINEVADYLREEMIALEYTTWEINEDELGGGLVYGGYAEYLILDNLAVGAEFIPLSSDGGLGWAEEYDDGTDLFTASYDLDGEASARLMSIYGAYLLPMGSTPAALRLGGGIGYLSGAKIEMDYDAAWEGMGEHDTWHESLKASGSAVAFHAFAGAEYRVLDHLVLCANAAYRVASVDELEVDSVDTEADGAFECVQEGKTLKWYNKGDSFDFTTERGDNIGLDFGGFYITVSAAFTFGP